jgi:predicted flap endonuclease-1-like 5' DNA nuclease
MGNMSMRLDYPLYGLAIVLFAFTAVTLAFVSTQDGGIIYAASTAIVGLLSIGGGYFLRPKATFQVEPPAPPAVAAESVPKTSEVILEAPKMSAPILDVHKTDVPTVEASSVQVASSDEAEKAETLKDAKVQSSTLDLAPALKTPQTDVALPAPPIQVAIPAPPIEAALQAPTDNKPELTKIRGISERRAEQLKANGVNTIEDLANASAEDLALKLSVSPKIVKMWIGSAKKLK